MTKENRIYLQAEKFGKTGEDCAHIYNKCEKSVLDIFTEVYNPFEHPSDILGWK